MIKKQELLRRLANAEFSIKYLRGDLKRLEERREKTDRTDYVLRFLADKLGYEIKLKDVVKVDYKGEKSIVTEVEMVEKKKDIVSSSSLTFTDGCCGSEEPKPKRKYNKRKKK